MVKTHPWLRSQVERGATSQGLIEVPILLLPPGDLKKPQSSTWSILNNMPQSQKKTEISQNNNRKKFWF